MAAALAARLSAGSILVSGTNGKTTTTRLIAASLAAQGWPTVHNRAGANLMTGVTAALLDGRGQIGLFEVDEAALPAAIDELQPRLVLCLNLFRDQLDRYGELNQLAGRWAEALERLPAKATVLLNADDPLVASLGQRLRARVLYFGLNCPEQGLASLQHAADSLYCPRCDNRLRFDLVYYGHLGHYTCPACDLARPKPSFEAHAVRQTLDGPTHFDLAVGVPLPGWAPVNKEYPAPLEAAAEASSLGLETHLPGLYNVYNALAAAAAALTLGVSPATVRSALGGFAAAFGRAELVEVDGKRLRLLLAKNPTGWNEVLRTLLLDQQPLRLYLALNDRAADGEDVSWIWDVDFEQLAGCAGLLVGGTRAEELALRLKYAGLPGEAIQIVAGHKEGSRQLLERTPIGGTAYAVTTYTAMLDLRRALGELGLVRHFWQD